MRGIRRWEINGKQEIGGKTEKMCAQCCCCSVLGAHIQKCCQTLSVWRTEPRAKSERNGIWHVCNCADTIIILLLLHYIHIVISTQLTMAMHNDDEVTAASHHTLINEISHFLSICLCIRIRRYITYVVRCATTASIQHIVYACSFTVQLCHVSCRCNSLKSCVLQQRQNRIGLLSLAATLRCTAIHGPITPWPMPHMTWNA